MREKAARVLEMVRKEFRQLLRDPRLARVIFVAPILQLMIFGYAVSTDVRDTPTFVVDHDGTQASRDLVGTLAASRYFRVVGRSERSEDIVRVLDHGDAIVGIEIPRGFARDLRGPSGASVQVLVDGTNSNTALVALGYAERIVAGFGARVAGAAPPAVDLRERAWFNSELLSRNYNVPAVIGAIMMLVALLLTALAIVREREVGTLEQLMVSPLTPGELIMGKTLPFAVIGLVDLGVVTTVALLWFGIPMRGSFLLLLLAALVFLLPALGLGLFVSAVSRTQQEAFMASFLIFLPAMLLSGFMFPVNSMPEAFQWITLLNPLRHYLVIVRAIFLKGVGLGVLWPQYLALAAMGVVLLRLAASRFRKTVA